MPIYPENSIIHAPLAGFTDIPYRNSAHRHGCKYAFAEMIDAGSLVYGTQKTLRFLERSNQEEWLGYQFVGSDTETLTKATKIIDKLDFDVLDFNLGCPAPKVSKKCEGAALARVPDAAIRAFDAIVKASTHPVTAKIRIIDELDVEPTLDLCKRLENSGAQAITIHGRIKEKFYSGPVSFNIISEVREALNIPVIANGGVMGLKTYNEIRRETGCDTIMVARGAMGNPWIFNILNEKDEFIPPTPTEVALELEQHVMEMVEYYGEQLAMKISRKIILDYLKGRGFGGAMKARVSKLCSKDDLRHFVDDMKKGPAESYWTWLKSNPQTDRPMSPE